jgi:WhiB family redox-sensing transcriptional regulator
MTDIQEQAREAAAGTRIVIPYNEWDWLRQRAGAPEPPPRPDHDQKGLVETWRRQRAQYWRIRDPEWRDNAACDGLDVDIFFPEKGKPTDPAKAVCAVCPVKDDCLADAMIWGERHGVRGGLSGDERRRLRKSTNLPTKLTGRAPEPIKHGTAAGYAQEYRRGIPRCQDCRTAHNRMNRGRYHGEDATK